MSENKRFTTNLTYQKRNDEIFNDNKELKKENNEIMDLRAKNTKMKLVIGMILDDLEKQAKSKEPIILSEEYVEWIKNEVDLRLLSKICEDDVGVWMSGKRFELYQNSNGMVDIIDNLESKEKKAICIYNDLGVLPYSSAQSLCDLLNELNDENEQFHNIARDYNIPFEKLCETFEDVLEENEQLKQQLADEKVRTTPITLSTHISDEDFKKLEKLFKKYFKSD